MLRHRLLYGGTQTMYSDTKKLLYNYDDLNVTVCKIKFIMEIPVTQMAILFNIKHMGTFTVL